ncbi:MAG TPA: histidine ammonia-lyase [Pirellulaceae bacterium]
MRDRPMGRNSGILELSGGPLTSSDVASVARSGREVHLAREGRERIQASRERLRHAMAPGDPIYGVNTGFGALGRVRIPTDQLLELQLNLIRSHSTGVGIDLPEDVVRGMMLVLAASLTRGYSGVRVEVVESLLGLLNRGVLPCIPEIGSVGASGDLAPLAHLALVLVGEGWAMVAGRKVTGSDALAAASIEPLTLDAKEGIALINGTHLMAARGALLLEDFRRLFDASLVAAAMSVDACRATDSTLDARVHDVRNQAGQSYVAARLRELLAGSQIIKSHRENDPRVQDPYSFRCCPAVLGAVWDQWAYVETVLSAELGAVTDNPLVFEAHGQACVISGGNFHGLPIALPLDTLAIGIAHLAGIAERRIYHMLSGADAEAELPTFLTPQAGLQSGLMIAQYTAAACCNELIGLTAPASVVNLPTSAGMEDYNSFGPRAAAKAARAMQLARSVVAIELLCAATGIDHHRPLRSGEAVERAFSRIRQVVPALEADRPPAPDIAALEALIAQDAFRLPPLPSSG